MMKSGQVSKQTKATVLTGLFAAIIMVMAFTPYLGYIPLGFMNATIIHIPVILGAIFLGPRRGAFLGGIFGLTSLLNNTFNPNITSFVFSPFYSMGEIHGNIASLFVCFVPRILTGITAYYVFAAVKHLLKRLKLGQLVAFAAAGAAGSLVNTLIVMNGIYFLFGQNFATIKGVATSSLYNIILLVIGTQGVPEAVLAAILVAVIGKVLYGLNRE